MKRKVKDPVQKYGGKRMKAPVLILLTLFILIAGSASWIYASDDGGFNEVRQLAKVKCLGCLGLDPVVPEFSEYWIAYPPDHKKANETVDHPEYVTDYLSDEDVHLLVLFFWTQGCVPCATQWKEMVDEKIASGPEDGGIEGDKYENLIMRSNDAAIETDLYHTYTPTGKETGVPMTTFLFKNSGGDILWYSHYGQMEISDFKEIAEDILTIVEAERLKDDYDDITSTDHEH